MWIKAGAGLFSVLAGVKEMRAREWLVSAENWKSVPAAGQKEKR